MEIEQFSFWRDFFLLKINPFHFDEIFDGKFQFQFLPQVWILKTKVDLAYRWFYDAFEINLLSWPTLFRKREKRPFESIAGEEIPLWIPSGFPLESPWLFYWDKKKWKGFFSS